ncbi:MAG: sensor histidine kinase [Candidatus Solibacter sp.]
MRTWPFLLIGFGLLLALIVLSAAALQDRMGKVFADVAAIQNAEQASRQPLDGLRSEIYLTSILVRDYLLDPSAEAAADERQKLEELKAAMEKDLAALEHAVRSDSLKESAGLREAILNFWKSIEPVFEWTPAERAARGPMFRRRSVVPYREVALAAAQRVGDVSARQTLERQQEVMRTNQELASFLKRTAGLALLLGGIVALASIIRTRSLERAAATHLVQIEQQASELRKLSHSLTKAQEEERRSLSRELHDQVGQMLTALSMELGNVEELRHTHGEGFAQHLKEAKELNQETLRTVRNISSGLRPSVLDELGLAPALQWQAREFTRRSRIPVDLQLDGKLDLPDEHRTCIYRVVQEALTNVARHAGAKSIRVTLHGGCDTLSLSVEDDGSGFDVQRVRDRGLGLLNIEERVRELGGRVQFLSAPSRGTLLRCEIPLPKDVSA